ncbi:hypothetical protein PHYPSEUDO_007231 [Phytophthora pseudosyringae]|uniref:RxLR effector protein n=1 Tax=Phytophthora pseudosyringae TaxID=221518 RepID=A0A8T1VJM7_9STRA|nr:hypothetical protein PHYPSEUDO_007231 [Phytophthora pseudosyringae]
MRFAVFLALLVATFVACASSFASADTFEEGFAIFDDEVDNVGRRLRGEVAVNKDNVAKISGGFLTKLKENAVLTKATKMAMAAKGDEAATRNAIKLAAGAREGAKMSDETMAKLSSMIAQTAKKNPKSWPRLRIFAKATLGAGVGALALYGAYKLMFDKTSTSAATTTTTTGSA